MRFICCCGLRRRRTQSGTSKGSKVTQKNENQLTIHKQMFARSSGDTERTLIKWPCQVLPHLVHTLLSVGIAPYWNRPSILNSFRLLEGSSKVLLKSFGLCLFSTQNNSHATMTHLGVASPEPMQFPPLKFPWKSDIQKTELKTVERENKLVNSSKKSTKEIKEVVQKEDEQTGRNTVYMSPYPIILVPQYWEWFSSIKCVSSIYLREKVNLFFHQIDVRYYLLHLTNIKPTFFSNDCTNSSLLGHWYIQDTVILEHPRVKAVNVLLNTFKVCIVVLNFCSITMERFKIDFSNSQPPNLKRRPSV